MLATFLLNADRPISVDKLIDALWNTPPRSAKAQLHNMICGLRRRLRDGDEELIASHRGGYQLHLGSHELDLLEFRRLVARGRHAAARSDHPLALSMLTAAMSLWRGSALGNIPHELATGVRSTLHEERFAAAEAKVAAELALGRFDDVLREAPALIAEHPYHECLHEKHLLALIGDGRRADALARYRRVHRQFVDELGIEPGHALRELEQRILLGDMRTGASTQPIVVAPDPLGSAR